MATRRIIGANPVYRPARATIRAGRGSRFMHSPRCSGPHAARIPTPALNRAIAELKEARQGPSGQRGRRLKLLYATQTATRPPRLRIFVNDPRLVTRDYGYWVENELRSRFELQGVPVSIDFHRSE